MLRILDIVPGTSVDGPGLRTAIYFAGCSHHCEGCHNPQSWDMDGGTEMTVEEIMERIKEEEFNVTFSGGDPLFQDSDELASLAHRINEEGYSLWCYTGFTIEHLWNDHRFERLRPWLDVLVDGPFIASLRDISLRFRGSSNQRLIDMRHSSPGNISIVDI